MKKKLRKLSIDKFDSYSYLLQYAGHYQVCVDRVLLYQTQFQSISLRKKCFSVKLKNLFFTTTKNLQGGKIRQHFRLCHISSEFSKKLILKVEKFIFL
jgi:hypothetical protein